MPETPHLVPLSRQAIALLRALKKITGCGPLLFPNTKDSSRPFSERSIGNALHAMGIDTQNEQDMHGFRGSAKTMLKKRGFSIDAIDLQLNHLKTDPYDDDDCWPERVRMMQAWADMLDKFRNVHDDAPRQLRVIERMVA